MNNQLPYWDINIDVAFRVSSASAETMEQARHLIWNALRSLPVVWGSAIEAEPTETIFAALVKPGLAPIEQQP